MPSRCMILTCESKKSKGGDKVAVFKVPKDNRLRAEWENSIKTSVPEVKCLRSNQYLCEKHFEERFVKKEVCHYDENGKLLSRVSNFFLLCIRHSAYKLSVLYSLK